MITNEQIKQYTENAKANKDIVKLSDMVKVHADGLYPQDLIDSLRPNEPEIIKAYRKLVWKPNTKKSFGKVLNLLSKINKAEDWQIKFPEKSGAIADNETLKEYLTEKYPYFNSLENYFFTVVLKKILTEPNGVCLVMPIQFDIPENAYFKPFAYVYEASQIIYFQEDLLVIRIEKTKNFEYSYIFVDKDEFVIFDYQVQGNPENSAISNRQSYTNLLGKIPAFKLGGLVKEFKAGAIIYESFLANALPDWDEAVRLYSDHQANLVMHIHPEKWMYEATECRTCQGTGKLLNEDGKLVPCNKINKSCLGNGFASTSPFGVQRISPNSKLGNQNGGTNVPIPPAGYITKPIENVQFLKTEIEDCIRQGFSALGLEFLAEIPLAQSGVAKEYDRDEINTFLYTVARHIIENWFIPVIEYTAFWRYQISLGNTKQIKDNLPTINIPMKYDSLTNTIIADRLKNANENGYDFNIRAKLQTEYAKKELGEDSVEWKIIKATYELNPLPDKTEDDKMTILANRGTTLENYVISANIESFVQRAFNENPKFWELDFKAKTELMKQYAKEIIESNKSNQIPIVQ